MPGGRPTETIPERARELAKQVDNASKALASVVEENLDLVSVFRGDQVHSMLDQWRTSSDWILSEVEKILGEIEKGKPDRPPGRPPVA
jgi:hypothetical protein